MEYILFTVILKSLFNDFMDALILLPEKLLAMKVGNGSMSGKEIHCQHVLKKWQCLMHYFI